MPIPSNTDPTKVSVSGKEGFNFHEDPAIQPGAKEHAGEKEVNKQEQEKTSGGYPKTGSGY